LVIEVYFIDLMVIMYMGGSMGMFKGVLVLYFYYFVNVMWYGYVAYCV